MKTVTILCLFGVAGCLGSLIEKEYPVSAQLRFINDEEDLERSHRVRRQTAIDRLLDFFGRRNKGDSDESEEDYPNVALPVETSEQFETGFYDTASDTDFDQQGSEQPLYQSYYESSDSEPTTTKKPKPAGKQAQKIELTLNMQDGSEMKMELGKRKKLTPKISSYKLVNGQMVPDDTPTSEKEIALFEDASNGTGSVFLVECGPVNCSSMGAILGKTAIYELESANAAPYSSKAREPKEGPRKMEDVRTMGVASDGSVLNIPFITRKKRDLLLTQKMKDGIRSRKRRQIGNDNVVELAIIADYSEYLYWLDRANHNAVEAKSAMQLYFILLTNMMDERFKDLTTQEGDVVTFMINQIIYIETEADGAWMEDNLVGDVVNVDRALDDLTVWAATTLNGLPMRPDHILVVSKRDLGTLVNGVMDNDPIGVAWTGGMCTMYYSISIVEDPGLGLIDYAATHEIGHSMSSNHDSASGCSDDDFYIMGAVGGGPAEGLSSVNKSGNPFLFSTCAAESIHNFISGLGSGSCLLNNNFETADYEMYKDFFAPGVFLPIDTQCELHYGNGSRRCYALEGTICSDGAWCWNPADPNYCYSLYVREGTLCSENKRCHFGLCEDSNLVAPTCPPSVYSSLFAEQAANNGGVVVDTGNNVAGDITVTVAPASGTSYATFQSMSTLEVDSADVIC